MNFQRLTGEMKRLEARTALALARAGAASSSSPSGGLTPPANGSWSVASWWIDPVAGSDTNTGRSSASPLKTWRRLTQLWGTISPVLRQATTITFLGAGHSDDSDPVIFQPYLLGPTTIVTLTGSLIEQWTGTMTRTAAKNRATGTLLTATLPAGAAAGQMVANTTHPSRCFIYQASGGNWELSQPFLTPPPPFAFVGGPSEVDTWATSDVVTGYTFTSINLVDVRPIVTDQNAGATTALYLTQCCGLLPTGIAANFSSWQVNTNVIIFDAMMERATIIDFSETSFGTTSNDASTVNVNYVAPVICPGAAAFPTWGCVGGIIGDSASSCSLDGDVIIGASGVFTCYAAEALLGMAYFDTSATIFVDPWAFLFISDTNGFGGPFIWGPGGALDVQGKSLVQYPAGSGKAVATFLQTGAITLNEQTSATSVTSAYAFATVSLTPAHLDAAAGAAGFGGTAQILGNATISNVT